MWATVLVFWMQAAAPPTSIGWSVYAPIPLNSDSLTASRCLARHRGTPEIDAEMRCRVVAGQMTDCDMADGRAMSRRNIHTLRCLAETQTLPAGAKAGETMLLTVTVRARSL